MPTKKIIVEIEFNNRSKPENRWKVGLTKRWIEYRMSIFMKYTLQSLKKQTNQRFTVLVRYAESSESNHKSFIQQLHNYKPKSNTRALINQSGYVYDSLRHRVATRKKSSPPFYTFIYKTSAYFKGVRYQTPRGHTSVIKLISLSMKYWTKMESETIWLLSMKRIH